MSRTASPESGRSPKPNQSELAGRGRWDAGRLIPDEQTVQLDADVTVNVEDDDFHDAEIVEDGEADPGDIVR